MNDTEQHKVKNHFSQRRASIFPCLLSAHWCNHAEVLAKLDKLLVKKMMTALPLLPPRENGICEQPHEFLLVSYNLKLGTKAIIHHDALCCCGR